MTSRGYVIQWRSKVNGRAGKGTKEFGRAEAEQLAEELNREYPQIHHEAVKMKVQSAREPERVSETHEQLVTVE